MNIIWVMSVRTEGGKKSGTEERIVRGKAESKDSWELHGRQA